MIPKSPRIALHAKPNKLAKGRRLNSEHSVGVFVPLEHTHFLKLQGSLKTMQLIWRTCFQENNSRFFVSGMVYISKLLCSVYFA